MSLADELTLIHSTAPHQPAESLADELTLIHNTAPHQPVESSADELTLIHSTAPHQPVESSTDGPMIDPVINKPDAANNELFEPNVLNLSAGHRVSIVDFSPYPKSGQNIATNGGRKRRAEVSSVVTSSPYKKK